MELSGKGWVIKFPTSKSTDDLEQSFKQKLLLFLQALREAGATVSISATYRPKERAYLMHYSFRIARLGLDARQVPKLSSVPIDWVHKLPNGKFDAIASRNAAEDMVDAYGIVYKPSLVSNHTRKTAVDMDITWQGTLKILKADGSTKTITSTPRNGMNAELHAVAKTYGVLKLISDPPHWSEDGH